MDRELAGRWTDNPAKDKLKKRLEDKAIVIRLCGSRDRFRKSMRIVRNVDLREPALSQLTPARRLSSRLLIEEQHA